jgi:hypothetical protein
MATHSVSIEKQSRLSGNGVEEWQRIKYFPQFGMVLHFNK